MERILFVEDDELIASGLVYALEQEGYCVAHCRDVAAALALLEREAFSLGLLDLSLPDGSGYTVCAALREQEVPVIFLTAVDDEGNAVKGLEMGADDYITKPFRLRELLARVRNALRRHTAQRNTNRCNTALDCLEGETALPVAPGIALYPLQGKVLRNGGELELTALEYRLLLTLACNRGQVLTRSRLLEGIWDVAGSFVNDNTLSVYVKRLRDKLGDDGQQPGIIETVRGTGYRLHG